MKTIKSVKQFALSFWTTGVICILIFLSIELDAENSKFSFLCFGLACLIIGVISLCIYIFRKIALQKKSEACELGTCQFCEVAQKRSELENESESDSSCWEGNPEYTNRTCSTCKWRSQCGEVAE